MRESVRACPLAAVANRGRRRAMRARKLRQSASWRLAPRHNRRLCRHACAAAAAAAAAARRAPHGHAMVAPFVPFAYR